MEQKSADNHTEERKGRQICLVPSFHPSNYHYLEPGGHFPGLSSHHLKFPLHFDPTKTVNETAVVKNREQTQGLPVAATQ